MTICNQLQFEQYHLIFSGVKINLNYQTPNQMKGFLCLSLHAAATRAASIAGNVTYVNYTLFPTATRILGSCHYKFVFFTLDY